MAFEYHKEYLNTYLIIEYSDILFAAVVFRHAAEA